jgi:hypothetical protein
VSLSGQLAEPQILHTVRADSVGNGRAVIPKKRRHVLLRQPLTSNAVAATPGAASDQGVGQRPQGIQQIAGCDRVVTSRPRASAPSSRATTARGSFLGRAIRDAFAEVIGGAGGLGEPAEQIAASAYQGEPPASSVTSRPPSGRGIRGSPKTTALRRTAHARGRGARVHRRGRRTRSE